MHPLACVAVCSWTQELVDQTCGPVRCFKLEKQVALKRRLHGGFDFDLRVPGGGIPDGAQNLHSPQAGIQGSRR